MKVVLNIDGGIGRVICSVPAVEQFCKAHPDTEIMTPWPGVFKNNPHVAMVHDAWGSKPHLWFSVIRSSDYRHPEPYQNHFYYTKKHHLIESFHYLINGEAKMETPNLYVTDDEKKAAIKLVNAIKEQQKAEKVIIFQPFGGSAKHEGQIIRDTTYRSLSLEAAHRLMDRLPANTRAIYRGVIPFSHPRCLARTDFTLRETIALVDVCDAVVGIDSCAQHMAYALNKPAITLWGSTAVENVGYKNFININRPGFPKDYVPYRFEFDQEVNKGAMSFTPIELQIISQKIEELLKGAK